MLRAAWQPAFHAHSLQRYSALMHASAERLVGRLGAAADGGEVVDIWRELGKMTLEVVGQTAYG